MANELQLSPKEAAKWKGGNGALSAAGGDFWIGVLAGRARAFSSGGTAAQPPYDHAGPAVRPGDELNGLLRSKAKSASNSRVCSRARASAAAPDPSNRICIGNC